MTLYTIHHTCAVSGDVTCVGHSLDTGNVAIVTFDLAISKGGWGFSPESQEKGTVYRACAAEVETEVTSVTGDIDFLGSGFGL